MTGNKAEMEVFITEAFHAVIWKDIYEGVSFSHLTDKNYPASV